MASRYILVPPQFKVLKIAHPSVLSIHAKASWAQIFVCVPIVAFCVVPVSEMALRGSGSGDIITHINSAHYESYITYAFQIIRISA